MQSRTIDAASTELRIHEWGERRAPAVLFWHALGDHTGHQIAEVAQILANEHGLRIAALDAPGFGGSPPLPEPEDYLLSRLAPLASAAAEALRLEQPVFAGASWGGSVALAAAAAEPTRWRGLALLDTGYQPAMTGDESLEELRAYWRAQEGFRFASWSAWHRDVHEFFGERSAALVDSLRHGYRQEDGEVVSVMGPDLYATIIWALRREPWTVFLDAVARSGLPVLQLAATEPRDREPERAEQLRAFAERIPQTAVERVQGAGHPVLEENPTFVAAALGAWARQLYA